MFKTSDTTAKLDAELAKVQAKIKVAIKDSENPFFHSRYADLAAVWDACRGPLTEHGIFVSQWLLHSDDDRVHLLTRISCAGEWMQAEWSIPTQKKDPQGFGAASTYARRYALAAALGVVADYDDDGNAASGNGSGGREVPGAEFRQVDPDDPRIESAIADWKQQISEAQDIPSLKKIAAQIGREPDVVRLGVRKHYGERMDALNDGKAKKK